MNGIGVRVVLSISYDPERIKKSCRASLVAQWLGVRLPMQGTRVRALVREDPTCCGSNWAHGPQLLSLRSRAREPQLLSPHA